MENKMAKQISKRGRPSEYTSAMATEICNTIASSSKGLKVLCDENSHWPNKDTIFTWLKNNHEFSDQYARAKCCQIECLVDQMLEISDDTSQDQLIDDQGKIVPNPQSINRARLRIDTRKWLACKLVPRVYGPKPPEESFVDPKLKQDIWERWAKLDEQNRKEY